MERFRAVFEVPLSEQSLGHLLRALIAVNCDYLRANPATPLLYNSGVRYRQERGENWQSIPDVLRSREGDCEDLACWRAAELAVGFGIVGATAIAIKQRVSGPPLYHIVVDAGGFIEDPSAKLGMRT